jgi:short-subunit dehydrogenase
MNAMQSLVSENAPDLRGCVLVIGVGVGEVEGIGGAVAKRFSQKGLHVYIVGRTGAKLEEVVQHIRGFGGHASAVVNDLRDEQAINDLFEAVIYNAAYADVPRRFSTMPASFFEGNWRLTCLAGLTVAKVAAWLMVKQGRGTLIFTGATASLRGKPLFAAFASAKAALRSFVLTLAAEVAPHAPSAPQCLDA